MSEHTSLSRLRAARIDGRTQSIRYRQNQLKALHECLIGHTVELKSCIEDDECFSPVEAELVFSQAVADLRHHYESLNFDKELEQEYAVANGRSYGDRRVGVGLVYIVLNQFCLLFGLISALSAAIAAGNCCIVELPLTYRTLSALLRNTLLDALDRDTFTIVDEQPNDNALADCLLVCQSDEQVTSTMRSRSVISPSSSSVVAVIDRTADVEEAALSIVSARFSFSGCSPIAPDCVLVNEWVEKPFLEAVIRQASNFMADTPCNDRRNGQVEKLIRFDNEKKKKVDNILSDFRRLDDTKIILDGMSGCVVRVRARSNPLRPKKIEGPVLVVHPVSSLDDAIDSTNRSLSTPLLATIVFADAASAKYISQFIPSNVSYINYIPISALLAPVAPEHHPVSLKSRYSRIMFERPSPQFIEKGKGKTALMADFGDSSIQQLRASKTALFELHRKAMESLSSTGQKKGRRVGFFEKGIMIGAAITVLPALLLVVGGLRYVLIQR